MGGPVLQVQASAASDDFRGTGGYGLRFSRRHGSADGQAGRLRHRYRRRRQHPDEHPGADHGGGQ